jgi:hypothetical protein
MRMLFRRQCDALGDKLLGEWAVRGERRILGFGGVNFCDVCT